MKFMKKLMMPVMYALIGLGSRRAVSQEYKNPFADYHFVSSSETAWKNGIPGQRLGLPEKGSVIVSRTRGDVLKPADIETFLKWMGDGGRAYVTDSQFGFVDSLTSHMGKKRLVKSYEPGTRMRMFYKNKKNDFHGWWDLKENPITAGKDSLKLGVKQIFNPRVNLESVLQLPEGVAMGVINYGKGCMLVDGTTLYPAGITTKTGNSILTNIKDFIESDNKINGKGIFEAYANAKIEGEIVGQYVFDSVWPGREDLKDVKNALLIEKRVKTDPKGKEFFWYNILSTLVEGNVGINFRETNFYSGINKGVFYLSIPDSSKLDDLEKFYVSVIIDGKWVTVDQISRKDMQIREKVVTAFEDGVNDLAKKAKVVNPDLFSKLVDSEKINESNRGIADQIEDDYVRAMFKQNTEIVVPFDANNIKPEYREKMKPGFVSLSVRTKKEIGVAGMVFKGQRVAWIDDGNSVSPTSQKISAELMFGSNKEKLRDYTVSPSKYWLRPYDN